MVVIRSGAVRQVRPIPALWANPPAWGPGRAHRSGDGSQVPLRKTVLALQLGSPWELPSEHLGKLGGENRWQHRNDVVESPASRSAASS
jgi:hypothetical protein